MLISDRLKGIAPFIYTAEAGSFVAAAERLNLSSSAVSKSVARLEARLGVTLFARTTRTLALTPPGRAFYETCTRVLSDLSEAEAVLGSHEMEPAGRIRLDLPASFGRMHVMPILLSFCEQYPKIVPYVSFTDRFVDLIDEGIDMAVRIGGSTDWPASLAHRSLGRERLIFCAAPAYLQRRGTPQTVPELREHACVAYGRPDGTVAPWVFTSEDGVIERRALAYRLVVADAEAQQHAVLAGLGLAQLATWLARDDLASGKLVQVLPSQVSDGLPLFLLWPLARQLTPKVDALLRVLQSQLQIA